MPPFLRSYMQTIIGQLLALWHLHIKNTPLQKDIDVKFLIYRCLTSFNKHTSEIQ